MYAGGGERTLDLELLKPEFRPSARLPTSSCSSATGKKKVKNKAAAFRQFENIQKCG